METTEIPPSPKWSDFRWKIRGISRPGSESPKAVALGGKSRKSMISYGIPMGFRMGIPMAVPMEFPMGIPTSTSGASPLWGSRHRTLGGFSATGGAKVKKNLLKKEGFLL